MLKLGIDELATQNHTLLGYTYFLIQDSTQQELEKTFKEIKDRHSIRKFHGRKYKSAQRNAYVDFLKSIKKALHDSNPSLFCMTLDTRQVHNDLTEFFRRTISDTEQGLCVQASDSVVIHEFTPYFYTFQRLSNHLQINDLSVDVEIDDGNEKEKLADIENEYCGQKISGAKILRLICNAYGKLSFPGSPKFTDSIVALPDKKSVLIQSADVFANFILAHMRIESGNGTKKLQEKSDILLEVFGDNIQIPPSTLSQIQAVGETELDLTLKGAINYTYGRQE